MLQVEMVDQYVARGIGSYGLFFSGDVSSGCLVAEYRGERLSPAEARGRTDGDTATSKGDEY